METIRKATVRELAGKIKGYGKSPRFAAFLGAGASRESGIITANEMAHFFKERILFECCPQSIKTPEEKESWLLSQRWYKGGSNNYSSLFEKYEPKVIGRQRYIESEVDGREAVGIL